MHSFPSEDGNILKISTGRDLCLKNLNSFCRKGAYNSASFANLIGNHIFANKIRTKKSNYYHRSRAEADQRL